MSQMFPEDILEVEEIFLGIYGWGFWDPPTSSRKLSEGISRILILPAKDSLTPFMR